MRVINRLVVVSGVAAAALLSPSVTPPSASAAPCTDVQVVFARGTFEAPGVGGVGQAFVDSLRSKIGDKSMDVYPVNYPASLDFATAADGVIDARNKVQDVANTCPNTEIVLGGFSQGAAVAGYITADAVPPGFTLPQGITGPMPSERRRPRRCRRALRQAVERLPADHQHRRSAHHGRQSVLGQDPRSVRARRPDLLTRRRGRRRTQQLSGQRDDRPGRDLCGCSMSRPTAARDRTRASYRRRLEAQRHRSWEPLPRHRWRSNRRAGRRNAASRRCRNPSSTARCRASR